MRSASSSYDISSCFILTWFLVSRWRKKNIWHHNYAIFPKLPSSSFRFVTKSNNKWFQHHLILAHHLSCRLSSLFAVPLVAQSRPSFWVFAVVEVKCIYSTLIPTRRERFAADYPSSYISYFLVRSFSSSRQSAFPWIFLFISWHRLRHINLFGLEPGLAWNMLHIFLCRST